MAKFKKITNTRGTHVFMCPGCQRRHLIFTTNEGYNHESSKWNGSIDKPTVEPEIIVNGPGKHHVHYLPVCHFSITNGRIKYLPDSTHQLAGKTVELPEIH